MARTTIPSMVRLPTGMALHYERVEIDPKLASQLQNVAIEFPDADFSEFPRPHWCIWLAADATFQWGTQLRLFDNGKSEVWHTEQDGTERRLDE